MILKYLLLNTPSTANFLDRKSDSAYNLRIIGMDNELYEYLVYEVKRNERIFCSEFTADGQQG